MEDFEKSVKFSPKKEISPSELEQYRAVQEIAKDTMNFLRLYIQVGMTEKEIAEAAEYYLEQKGVNAFWYHGVGALVFVGERTSLSISGRDYQPSDEKVKANDIVTVDLSPEIEGFWGDYARTFIVSKGKVIDPEKSENEIDPEMAEGIEAEKILQWKFQEIVSESMSLEDAYNKMNKLIEELCFDNLDFKKNLGHSIEKDPNNRKYIEAGNAKIFGEAGLFTFEPHIQKKGGKYGFKREDIYYFQNGKVAML